MGNGSFRIMELLDSRTARTRFGLRGLRRLDRMHKASNHLASGGKLVRVPQEVYQKVQDLVGEDAEEK